MNQRLSVSNVVLNMLVESAKKLNLPIEELINQLPEQSLLPPNEKVRLPNYVVPKIWQWFAKQKGLPNIGFRLAQVTPLVSQSVLTYLAMSSKTLGDAIKQVITYQWLISETNEFKLEVEAEQSRLILNFHNENYVLSPQNEYGMLLLFNWFNSIVTGDLTLIRAEFMHEQPGVVEEYLELFGCDVYFATCQNALVFDRKGLELPIRYANENLHSFLTGQLDITEKEIIESKLVYNVIKFLKESLHQGKITLSDIAIKFELSPRKLKMILENQNTNLSQLIENERKLLAQRLLMDESRAITDVSDACGFSEPSVFNRAFKRWFDQTPSQFREMQNK